MIQVAIVEDEAESRARIKECLAFLEETENMAFSVSEFSTGTAFLGSYSQDYDIVFMDIEMPGMDGMECARALRKMDTSVVLIFVTNLAQFAITGYEVEALDFILKPINKYSFAMKVKRAVARTSKRHDEFIAVKTEGETRSVRIASIKYLEVTGHYVVYHTTEGDITEYITLKDVYGKINRSYFVYASRSFLVNLRYVTAVNRETVSLGEDEVLISRPQRRAFLAAVSDYMGGRL